MSCAVDTNVLIDVVAGTQDTARRAATALYEQGARTALVISPVVYAELHAHPGWEKPDIDRFLRSTAIAVDCTLGREVWEIAGSAFSAYARRRSRQRDGSPRRLLADFIIGAHAAHLGTLVTGDRAFYLTNFPKLRVIGI